jgi:predicted nucleotidyltransferase
MYTIRHDKPVNPVILEILTAVQAATREVGCPYLLVGATARDMLMTHVFGIDVRRATHDVDFAIALESWDQFHELKATLLASGDFTTAADKVHLLHYKFAEYGNTFPLDLIPFGGVEQDAHQIAWPPDMNVVMNVTGYAEALASALDVDTGDGRVIRVVSISSLAALKLLAWNDRGLQDNKDAQDLFFLLKHYHEAGNHDRMWDEAIDLLEACGYDLSLASATLLGQDTSVLLHEDSLRTLLAILADPRKRDRLVVHMTRSSGIESDTADKLLSQFELGLRAKKIPAA